MGVLSYDQRVKALAYVPRVPACLSVIGSCCIIFAVLAKKGARHEFYHAMMLVLSVYDLVGSLWLALGSVPVPAEYGIQGSFGTTQSCSAQGFFIHFSAIGSSMVNAALMVYFVLRIRYNVQEKRLKQWSACIHVTALVLSLSLALSGVLLQVMNPIGFGGPSNAPICYIQAFPPGCDFIDEPTCTRGGNASTVIWPIAIVPFMLATAVFMVAVATVAWTVIIQERKTRQFSLHSISKIATAVVRRCLLYALVFFNTFLWTTVSMIIHNNDPPKHDTFWLGMLAFIFMPLQGFLNFFIYIQPRYTKIRGSHEDKTRAWALSQALLGKSVVREQYGGSIGTGDSYYTTREVPIYTEPATNKPSLDVEEQGDCAEGAKRQDEGRRKVVSFVTSASDTPTTTESSAQANI